MATPDLGHQLTDQELAKLEKRISSVYSDAAKELQKTIDDYFAKFAERDKHQQGLLEAGKITEEQYKQWRLAQIGRGGRFEALRDQVAERMTKANQTAVSYVNDATPGIYSLNRNYAAYTIEQVAGDVGFTLWDEQTVKRLIVENPDLMPYYPAKRAVNRGIDLAYGKKQITASVASSILQGKSIRGVADDLQTRIPTMNRDSAIRTARTAVTGAQNAGRQDSYIAAEKMGIELKREWVCTLDARTRDEHATADGQVVGVDEPFTVGGEKLMYPGDRSGSPWNVYNCRCTQIAKVKGADTSNTQRRVRDTETGESVLISDMPYSEWTNWKDNREDYAPVVEGERTLFNHDLFSEAKDLTRDIVDEKWEYEHFGFRAQTEDTEQIGEKMTHRSMNFGGDFEGEENEYEELPGVSTIGINDIESVTEHGGYEGTVLYLIGGDSAQNGYDPGESIIDNPVVLAKMRVQDGKLILAEKVETDVTESAIETAKEVVESATNISGFAGTKAQVDEYLTFKAEMEAKYGADAIWGSMSDPEYDKLERLERIAYTGK